MSGESKKLLRLFRGLSAAQQVVTKAVNRGVPFVIDQKNQLASRGIFSLAESVRARVAALESSGEVQRPGRR